MDGGRTRLEPPVRPRTLTTATGQRLSIRPAVPADAAAVVALYRTVLEEGRYFITRAGELTDTPERRAALLQALAQQDNALCLVAHLQAAPPAQDLPALVGMISIRGGILSRMRHVGKLEIFVSEAARGQGVGRALMAAGLDWAEANPILRKIGLSVFADNARAVALYQALGFEQEGHRRGEYAEADGTLRDELLLCRWVDAPPRTLEIPALFREA